MFGILVARSSYIIEMFTLLVCIALLFFIDQLVALDGAHRRILRAISIRMKNGKTLRSVELPAPITPDKVAFIEKKLQEAELVQIRFPTLGKKHEVKAIGSALADTLNCECVQVLGHCALFYLPSDPPGDVTKIMLREYRKANDETGL